MSPTVTPSASPSPAFFSASAIVVLRVGVPYGPQLLPSVAAPIFLDALSPATGAAAGPSLPIAGASLSGADPTMGTLVQRGDGLVLTFVAYGLSSGMALNPATAPIAVVNVNRAGIVGVEPLYGRFGVTGTCAVDALGYWVFGPGLVVAPNIAAGAVHDATRTFGNTILKQWPTSLANSSYTGCFGSRASSLYILRQSTANPPHLFLDMVRNVSATRDVFDVMEPLTTTLPVAAAPLTASQVLTNRDESRIFVAVITAQGTDGSCGAAGIFTSPGAPQLFGMSQMVGTATAPLSVYGMALSPDEATLFFAASAPGGLALSSALYTTPAGCLAACAVTLLKAAAQGTAFLGVAAPPIVLQPSASPSASPSPTRSASPSSSTGAPASASPSPSVPPFSIVALRVGAAGGAALTGETAPLFLDEFSPQTRSQLSSAQVAGITLPGADASLGALSRSSDGASLLFAGVAAGAGASATEAAGASRAVARVDAAGNLAVTTFGAALFGGGLVSGVCSVNGSSYVVVGRTATAALANGSATAALVGFVAHGSVDALQALRAAPSTSMAGGYASCALAASGALLLARNAAGSPQCGGAPTACVDVTSAAAVAAAAAANASLPITAATGPSTGASVAPAQQLVANGAGSRFFLAVAQPASAAAAAAAAACGANASGIFAGPALASAAGMSPIVSQAFSVTGLALSPDEGTLFFAARLPAPSALYSVPAACSSQCVATLLAVAPPGTEFRGVALRPLAAARATASPSPSAAAASATPSASPTPPRPTPSPTASATPGTAATPTATPGVGSAAARSTARQWMELLLQSIRLDLARPTVHARNLFHLSVALWDAWATFDARARPYIFAENHSATAAAQQPGGVAAARIEAMSYAAFALLQNRFYFSPGYATMLPQYSALMQQLGLQACTVNASAAGGDTAQAIGVRVGQAVIAFGLQDGSRQVFNYGNKDYKPSNPALAVFPAPGTQLGNPNAVDATRWQPLQLQTFIDQAGNAVPGGASAFLGAEWGRVVPFALSPAQNATVYSRGGTQWPVYNDPGAPPALNGAGDALWRSGLQMVALWSAHLDPKDNATVDISPGAMGNISPPSSNGQLPGGNLSSFYRVLEGGDVSTGYRNNPVTGLPYSPNVVLRGDYARVIAEYWADGPSAETPPGHWFTIWHSVVDSPLFSRRLGGAGAELDALEFDVKAYLALGGAMHDTAISIWSAKGWYDQSRPVTALRWACMNGQSSDPAGPSFHPDGIALVPGRIEVVTAASSAPGQRHAALNASIGQIALLAYGGPAFVQQCAFGICDLVNVRADPVVAWGLCVSWFPYQRAAEGRLQLRPQRLLACGRARAHAAHGLALLPGRTLLLPRARGRVPQVRDRAERRRDAAMGKLL